MSLVVLARFPDVSGRSHQASLEVTAAPIVDEIQNTHRQSIADEDAAEIGEKSPSFEAAGEADRPTRPTGSSGRKIQPQVALAAVFLVFVAVLAFMIVGRNDDSPSETVKSGWPTPATDPSADPPGPSGGGPPELQLPDSPGHSTPGTPAPGVNGETAGEANQALPHGQSAEPAREPVGSDPHRHGHHVGGVPGVARLNGTIGKTDLRSH